MADDESRGSVQPASGVTADGPARPSGAKSSPKPGSGDASLFPDVDVPDEAVPDLDDNVSHAPGVMDVALDIADEAVDSSSPEREWQRVAEDRAERDRRIAASADPLAAAEGNPSSARGAGHDAAGRDGAASGGDGGSGDGASTGAAADPLLALEESDDRYYRDGDTEAKSRDGYSFRAASTPDVPEEHERPAAGRLDDLNDESPAVAAAEAGLRREEDEAADARADRASGWLTRQPATRDALRDSRDAARSRNFIILFFVVVAAVLAMVWGGTQVAQRDSREYDKDASAVITLVSAQYKPGATTKDNPNAGGCLVNYEFEVNKTKYTGSTTEPTQAACAQKKGDTIAIQYNGADPSRNRGARKRTDNTNAYAIVFVLVVVVVPAYFLYRQANKRRIEEEGERIRALVLSERAPLAGNGDGRER